MTLQPDIKLSKFHNGVLSREPVMLTIIGLRATLLQTCDFDEAKVNQIYKTLNERGSCRMGLGDGSTYYQIDRLLVS